MDPLAQNIGRGGPGSSKINGRCGSISSTACISLGSYAPRSTSTSAEPSYQPELSSTLAPPSQSSLEQASSSPPPPSSTSLPRIPYWQQDAIDLEAGCVPWAYARDSRPVKWPPRSWLSSRLERKAREPAACDAIDYDMRPRSPMLGFLVRLLLFFLYCLFLSLHHHKLGLQCATDDTSTLEEPEHLSQQPDKSLALLWAETLVTTGACFLLAQGYYGIRASRERMERVRQTSVTLAYSFIKTTSTDCCGGYSRDELQLCIYECLALLTAYPVALLQQIRGNTCEPAITRYCQDVARALHRLRNGDDSIIAGPFYWDHSWIGSRSGSGNQFATVEYFFEVFSLRLQMEFSRQAMRTKTPSLASQHIIYSLRNHFENLVDLGHLDDRRTPIIRENIDMLSLAGRECSIFGLLDVIPLAFLWSVDLSCRLLAFASPIQNCDWIVNSTASSDAPHRPQIPTVINLVSMLVLAVVSATLMTVLDEMWKMWDPFDSGCNTYAWSLGTAMEIDNMLNEFYEYDTKGLLRKHAYMDPPRSQSNIGNGLYECEGSGPRAQTV